MGKTLGEFLIISQLSKISLVFQLVRGQDYLIAYTFSPSICVEENLFLTVSHLLYV